MIVRAVLAVAGTVLLPWAVTLAVLAAVLTPPPEAHAAPRTRFVQVMAAGTSVGVMAAGTRLRCVSAVTGLTGATVSVTVGPHPVWTARRVRPHTETGCAGRTGQLLPAGPTVVVVRIGTRTLRTTLR